MTNPDRDELVKLEAERAELIAKNEAATSWGAAVGARSERIKEIDGRIAALLTAPGATTKSDGAASDDIDTCIACNVPFVDDDMVYSDAGGGCIHAACCGPERDSYVGDDGEPLKDGEPIPAPWPWTADPSSSRSDVTVDELAREMQDVVDEIRSQNWKCGGVHLHDGDEAARILARALLAKYRMEGLE